MSSIQQAAGWSNPIKKSIKKISTFIENFVWAVNSNFNLIPVFSRIENRCIISNRMKYNLIPFNLVIAVRFCPILALGKS